MNETDFLRQSAGLFPDVSWVEPAVSFVAGAMEQDGGHDFGHLYRVLANAMHIAESEGGADAEVVAAAVLFHDLVNLAKDHPERHLASTRSADAAVEFLRSYELSERQLDLVHEAIRCHSFSAGITPQSAEAKIVSDADNLEAIGALGIARTFYVGGCMGTAILDQADPFAEDRELDDTRYSVDHFFRKLLGLADQFYTATGRQMADERDRFLRDFLDQLRREIGAG